MEWKLFVVGLFTYISATTAVLCSVNYSQENDKQIKREIYALVSAAESETHRRAYDKAIGSYKNANERAASLNAGCNPKSTPFKAGINYYYDMALVYRTWGKTQAPAIRRGNYRKALAALNMAIKCETTYKHAMRRLKSLEGFLNSDLGQGEASLAAFTRARSFPVGDSNIADHQIDGVIAQIKQVLKK